MTKTLPWPADVSHTGMFRHHGAVMGAAMLGFFVVALDAQIVNVALPDIGSVLDGDLTDLQWIVTAYTLTFSVLILLAGTVSDRLGARHSYVVGMLVFALASALCGAAPNLAVLVAARVLQGLGAALVAPTSLSLIREGIPDAKDRTRALGTWAVGGSLAAVAGPLLGGVLTQISWRLIFWVNLPVAAVALALALRTPASPRSRAPFDVIGQACSLVTLGTFTFAVIEGPRFGWSDPVIVGLLVLSAASGLAFWASLSRVAHPMIPPNLFALREVSVALTVAFASMAAFYLVIFVQSLYFQTERGQDALTTGLLFLPMTAVVTIVSTFAGGLIERFGTRPLVVVGLVVQALGVVALASLPADVAVWWVSGAMVAVGLGGSLTVPPIASIVMENASPSLAGTSSGVLNASRQLGGSLGVAVVGAIVASHANFDTGLRIGLVSVAAVLAASALTSLALRQQHTS